MAERTLENAQKTKEKAKSWGFKGIGFLSSAVSTAKAAVAGVCPHTAVYVSSYYYMCPHTSAVSTAKATVAGVCLHTAIYVSSYYHVCVLIPALSPLQRRL